MVDWEGDAMGAETIFIVYLSILGVKKVYYNKVRQEIRDEIPAGIWRQLILG